MATSPIYSWPEPDNTDLIKNGALAIRTLGDAIDTTMGTMTPKSTYTAKGSIAAATAASTPANLSVGTNYAFLQADSTQSTGLVWGNTWTAFNPTVTSSIGSAGSVTATGGYQRIGKTCVYRFRVVVTSLGTASGDMLVTLPFAAKSSTRQVGVTLDTGLTGAAGVTWIKDDGTMSSRKYDFTTYWALNSDVVAQITYEVN